MYAEPLVSRQLSPSLEGIHGEHRANTRRNSFSIALLRFQASGGLMGARHGDTVAAILSAKQISFNDAKQVGIVTHRPARQLMILPRLPAAELRDMLSGSKL
jgi:hypothetical protein